MVFIRPVRCGLESRSARTAGSKTNFSRPALEEGGNGSRRKWRCGFYEFWDKEVKPQYVAVWIPQWNLRQAFQYMDKADYESVRSWTWVKITQRGKIRGTLGKLFQRSHEVLYFFKRRDVEGSVELGALREQEVIFADRTK
eukprot:augustus_masked-scaffold_101-processed-gene-0.9-mRNA-1 protein AED:1.00 eAED:1.00 QI:0/-1/0/0/-1/1/1/0/140